MIYPASQEPVSMQDEPTQPLQVGDFSGDGLNDVILLSGRSLYGYQQVRSLCLHASWWLIQILRQCYALCLDGSSVRGLSCSASSARLQPSS